jgi:hypothetical protein
MGAAPDFRFSPRPNRAAEIAWRPWGEPAFEEARRLGRPVLLSLSAVWCHWCHVMDETSYSDTRVIRHVNERFIPIRVDNDRNPDVNRRYNMGGWPTTAFLTPGGEVITGATYLPADQMIQALERVSAFFDDNKAALTALGTAEPAHANDREAALAQLGGVPVRRDHADLAAVFEGDPDIPGDIPAEVARQVVNAFDPMYGGVGTQPKFPQAEVFAFLLAFGELRRETDEAARIPAILATTLANMAHGGMYDGVAGGFFRYATRRDWSVPHYEKMLEDNARLIALYADAAARAPDDAHARTAEGAVAYLMDTLWRGDPPAFAGSQDADEEYYALDADGRAALAAPFVDTTVYVDWNALAARGLLRAAAILRRPHLTERAVELLRFLWTHARRDGAMVHYLLPGGEHGDGAPLLVDQATVAAALLDAYESTGERMWLEGAQALAEWVGEHLRGPDGRLHDRLPLPGASAGLLSRAVPALEENALMTEVLLRLGVYTGEPRCREHAREVLAAWAPHYRQHGVGAAPYGTALLRYLERPDHIAVIGSRDDVATVQLHQAALAAPRSLRTVQLLDPRDDADALDIVAGGLEPAASPAAYVCRGQSCMAPARDPGELGARLAGT